MKLVTASDLANTRKFRRHLFFYLASALFVLTSGLVALITHNFLDYLRQAETNTLIHLCEIRALTLSQWCLRAQDIARQITSRTRIMQDLEQYNQGRISLASLIAFSQPKLLDAMKSSHEILGITRLDQRHQPVVECGIGLAFLAAEVTDFISDKTEIFIPCKEINCSYLIISAPILNRAGLRQGTDLVIFNTNNLIEMVSNFDKLGATSAIIVGYQCNLCQKKQIAPLLVSQRKQMNYQPIELFAEVKRPIAGAIAGENILTSSNGFVVASQPVAGSGWALAIAQNKQELFEPLYNKILLTYVMSFFAYVFILYGFWSLMRPLAGKMLLHASELEIRIEKKTKILQKEIEERKKAEFEKAQTIAQLQEAQQKIRILGGLIPICANCKKIRDDRGFWCQLETYIKDHSEADFTHGICPECIKELYPELEEDFASHPNREA